MLSYYLKSRKYTESKNLGAAKTNEAKIKLLSKCAVCDKKIDIYQKARSKWIIK